MEISEVRVKLVPRSTERLRAFCSITLDGDFVIRDLKIIDGTSGPFVAMPSRKLADRCNRCGCKNHLRAKYCNECGQKLGESRTPKDTQGRAKLHADVAHPINAACRERIQNAVITAYQAELERAKSPDYKPPRLDDFEDETDEVPGEPCEPAAAAAAPEHTDDSRNEGANVDADFSDYDSLITDLKREAADRHKRHGERRQPTGYSAEAETRSEPALEGDHPARPPRPDRDEAAPRPEQPISDDSPPSSVPEPASDKSTRPPERETADQTPAKGPDTTAPPAPEPAPPPPPPSFEDRDEAGGFGAGVF